MKTASRQLIAIGIALFCCACRSGLEHTPSEGTITTEVATTSIAVPATIHPDQWPLQTPVMTSDRETEAKIAYLLSRMTIEEKVGQVIQADIASVTPEQVREYNLGSVLNGGSSAPGGDNRATPDKWLALADEFWDASIDTSDGGVGIPVLWGTDAVHGHSNILGATLFPHNIGLGMANDPDMMESIGQATALEMRVTGLDWTFAPTIAVVRNDRWGRTYESYSEDPAIVAAYAPRIIQGLQGRFGSDKFLDEAHLMATAKHFAGDGGTVDGIDQGDNQSPESVLRDQQAAAYPPAIAAGVQSVMASFNSYHGRKMHGFKPMLSDVLVGRMGFDGFVVGDWNGHGQVIGCSNTACAQSFNAGLDMFMAPDSWQGLYESMLEQLASGQILESRLDEAVSRILRVKMRARLFDAGPPSSRKFAGDYDLLASTQHRALARDAVRKSLVLLKNQNRVLPIGPGTRVLLAGDGAHNIGKQSGGWTLNWQGTGNLREHFPSGSSIYEGFVEALGADNVELAENGEYRKRPDVAVVVFGENPYAEFQGDRADVDYPSGDGLALLEGFRKAGIATVSVFISGRPLFVNPELNASDAFVAAWLPGSEGSGVADVLVADDAGEPRFDFLGRLSFSWPKLATQTEVNIGDPDYDPLFAYGYGLSYVDSVSLGLLDEDSGLASGGAVSDSVFIDYGDPVGDWSMVLRDVKGGNRIADSRGKSIGGAVSVAAADRNTQEDTVIVQWMSAGAMTIEGGPVDLAREANGDMVLQISYSVLDKGAGPVSIGMASEGASAAVVDVTEAFSRSAGQGWQTGQILLSCFVEEGLAIESVVVPLEIYSKSQMQIQIASAMIAPNPGDADCAL